MTLSEMSTSHSFSLRELGLMPRRYRYRRPATPSPRSYRLFTGWSRAHYRRRISCSAGYRVAGHRSATNVIAFDSWMPSYIGLDFDAEARLSPRLNLSPIFDYFASRDTGYDWLAYTPSHTRLIRLA